MPLCKQCAEETSQPTDQLANRTTSDMTERKQYSRAMCDFCGPCAVDHTGRCVAKDCLRNHGLDKIFKSPRTVPMHP